MAVATKSEVENFVDRYISKNGIPPTYKNISNYFDISVSSSYSKCSTFRKKMAVESNRLSGRDELNISKKERGVPYKCYMLIPGLYSLKVFNKIEGLLLSDLVDTICGHYGQTSTNIEGWDKSEDNTMIRQHISFFARKYTHSSLKDIGLVIGKAHATVMHSIKVVNNNSDTNHEYRAGLNLLNAHILNKHSKSKTSGI